MSIVSDSLEIVPDNVEFEEPPQVTLTWLILNATDKMDNILVSN